MKESVIAILKEYDGEITIADLMSNTKVHLSLMSF